MPQLQSPSPQTREHRARICPTMDVERVIDKPLYHPCSPSLPTHRSKGMSSPTSCSSRRRSRPGARAQRRTGGSSRRYASERGRAWLAQEAQLGWRAPRAALASLSPASTRRGRRCCCPSLKCHLHSCTHARTRARKHEVKGRNINPCLRPRSCVCRSFVTRMSPAATTTTRCGAACWGPGLRVEPILAACRCTLRPV
jgi:hypothetical protein